MAAVSGTSILAIFISLAIIVVLIFNTVYINAVRGQLNSPGTNINLSSTGATVIFWVDIILTIIMILYLFWTIWKIFTTPEQRKYVTQVATAPQANVGGFPIPTR